MPGFETNLLAVLVVVMVLAVLASLSWALWKPLGQRIWRYLQVWWQQDKIAEAEAKRTIQARRAARQELDVACGADAPAEEEQNRKADRGPSLPTRSRQPQPDDTPAQEAPKISLIGRR